jgi:hypothetical protein
MFLIGFPLLLVPFALYNILVFILGITNWAAPILSIHIISGSDWTISWGDLLIALGILMLFVEILKSTRIGMRSIVDHMLSTLLFVAMIVEFLLVKQAGTSTFFLLIILSLVDVLAGFTVTIRTARRDIEIDNADRILPT